MQPPCPRSLQEPRDAGPLWVQTPLLGAGWGRSEGLRPAQVTAGGGLCGECAVGWVEGSWLGGPLAAARALRASSPGLGEWAGPGFCFRVAEGDWEGPAGLAEMILEREGLGFLAAFSSGLQILVWGKHRSAPRAAS